MIRTFILPENIETDGVCLVIDVLRATSTIVTALSNGALLVKPVEKIEEAINMKEKDFLLCGERNGLKIEGFDLGNSPLEYKKEIVKGKKIVLTTTNGTKAIKLLKASKIIAVSFLNVSFAVNAVKNFEEINIVCSGTNGKFSLEDFLLSGLIVKLLNRKDIDDASKVAMRYYESVENVESEIRKSSHAQRLINLGFEKDIIFCSQIDLFNTVPILKNDAFIATNSD